MLAGHGKAGAKPPGWGQAQGARAPAEGSLGKKTRKGKKPTKKQLAAQAEAERLARIRERHAEADRAHRSGRQLFGGRG